MRPQSKPTPLILLLHRLASTVFLRPVILLLPMSHPLPPLTLVDAHVHLHRCFAVETVLSAALRNFAAIAQRLGQAQFFGCLLLTEMAGETWFLKHHAAVHNRGETVTLGDWTLAPTAERQTLLAIHSSGTSLGLFAGRQIITQEKLEVLALMTAELFPDGRSLSATVAAIAAAQGLPVLPWGVGKWIGARGRLVANYLQTDGTPPVYLGDNGGRPLGWSRPQNFQLATRQNLPILSGTDPLPIPSEANRPGSFGFSLPVAIDHTYPAAALCEAIRTSPSALKAYGPLEMPWRFVRNQVALRL